MCLRHVTRVISPSLTSAVVTNVRHSSDLAIYSDRAILVLNKPPGVDSQLRKEVSTSPLDLISAYRKQDSEMRDIIVDECHPSSSESSKIDRPFHVPDLGKETQTDHPIPVHRLDKVRSVAYLLCASSFAES